MMNEDIFTQTVDIASAVFGVPRANLDPHSSPATVENWDSLNHLMFIMALEEHFRIKYDPSEIENLLSLGMIEEAISRKMAQR